MSTQREQIERVVKDFAPIRRRVLIEVETDHVESDVLITLRTERRDIRTGFVRKVGPEVTDLSVGDRVAFPHRQGAQLKIAGAPFAIIDERTVLGVLDDTQACR